MSILSRRLTRGQRGVRNVSKFPLKPIVIFSLVNSLRKTTDRPLLVAGQLADVLARELTAGGDAWAVRTGGVPTGVEALVYVVGDTVTTEDEQVLKAAHRAHVPTIVVAAGREAPVRIPFVLATDVVRVPTGSGFPVDRIAHVLMHKLGEEGSSLARHLPVLRRPFCSELTESFARKNGLIGVAVFVPGVDFPILTLNQLRLVLRICAAHGLEIDGQRVPEIAATIGVGFGFRTIARELLAIIPFAGWALKGAIAYAGTRAVGEAAVRYCEARAVTPQQAAASPS
jgi:uncharacterized protein (DUF697 family)